MLQAHILLVEDDDRARALFARVLAEAGYHVSVASGGAMAIDLLASREFDAVVTDIKMPQVDGLQVLRYARSQPSPPKVILMTGFGSLESSVAALRAGAYDYLLKPCDSSDLLVRVASAVQHRAAELRQAQVLELIAQDLAQLRDLDSEPPPASAPDAPEEVPEGVLCVGALRLDSLRRTASFMGMPLHLTPIEYTLLHRLADQPGQAVSYVDIVRHTHGRTVSLAEAQVLLKPHLRNLRRKLAPGYLVNIRGIGYTLFAPPEDI